MDVIQRQNVIETIPTYAPQIIMFSKDDLTDCFENNSNNNVWTIFSNAEKNVAKVKEGYFPEVFEIDGHNS